MKKLLAIGCMVIFAFATVASGAGGAEAALKHYSLTIVDEFGQKVTDATSSVVYIAGSSAATVYTDATGDTAVTDELTSIETGQIDFWYEYGTCDIIVTHDDNENAVKVLTVTPMDHRIMLATNWAVVTSAATYTGTVTGVASTWTGTMTLGVDGTGVDFLLFGDTASNTVTWDYSDDQLEFVDADIHFDDDSDIIFGTGLDWTIDCDAAKRLDFIPVTTDDASILGIGDANHTADLLWYTKTASSIITIDASADLMHFVGVDLRISDDDFLTFGTADDIKIEFQEDDDDAFKIDCTTTVAGDALILETTDGGILVHADGSSNGDIELDAADDMTLTAAGDLTLAVTGTYSLGGAAVSNGLLTVEVVATETNELTAAESGKVLVSDYTGTQTHTLPDAAAGLIFHFVDNSLTGGDDVIIDCQVGDNIDGATNGNYIESVTDALGQNITLLAIDATRWVTLSKNGTWGTE